MKSILEEIYYSEEGLCEKDLMSDNYRKIKKEYEKIHDTLESGLNEEQKQILDDLFLSSCGLESEMACSHFKEGFKMGMLVALEVLS